MTDAINMTIYGKKSSTYEYMKMMLLNSAKESGIEIKLKEENEIEVFIKEQINHIPAIKVEGNIIEQEKKDINEYIKSVSKHLIKRSKHKTTTNYLVPIDYSEASENAVNFALQLSNYNNGIINLLHVYKPIISNQEELGFEQIEINSRKELEDFKNGIETENLFLPPNTTLINSTFKVGYAAEQILSESLKHDNCLVIMGSTGNTGNMKNIFGSVSTYVAKNSKTNILVVPKNSKFEIPTKIAYCTENAQTDAYAIQNLTNFAKKFNSEIHLIHIRNQNEYYQEKEIINMFSNFYPKDMLEFAIIDSDDKIASINDYCNKNNIKLLSMRRNSRSVFENLFHKSFTKKMTINSRIPLLVLNR